jgi:hypothetical protein
MNERLQALTIADIIELQQIYSGFFQPAQFATATIQGEALKPISDDTSWEIGKNYLIRTVTMIDTGKLVAVTQQELVLEDAAWIPDTGRFADAVAKAEFGEVEPFPAGRVIIGRGAIVDAVQIKQTPKSQK